MNISWQDIVALSLAALAGVYLARRTWLILARRGKGAACGGCGECAAAKASTPPVVQLDLTAPVPRGEKTTV